MTTEQRFWSKINKTNVCWLWIAGLDKDGYGKFFEVIDGKRTFPRAHRYSWQLHNGPIPDGMLICHHCDNPTCVKPDHLFLGTPLDNMHDKYAKKRAYHPKGDLNISIKITDAEVLYIKEYPRCSGFAEFLANKFNCSPSHIYNIKNGYTRL